MPKRRRKPKTNRKGDTQTAHPMDACQTPPYAVEPLVPYLTPGITVWESAAGEGYLAAALREAGMTVIETDILTGANFFEEDPPDGAPVQITNPPYLVKYEWLDRSYDLGIPFALLMPVDVTGADAAASLFERYGVEIIFMRPRVDFKMPQQGWNAPGAQFSTAWFTHGLDIGRELTWATISKMSKQQLMEMELGYEQLTLFEQESDHEQFTLLGGR